MAIRKKQEPSEYQKALCKFHKKSNRHVVVFEADISEDEKRRIFVFPHLIELLSFPVHGLDPILFHTVSARHDIFLCAKAAPDFVP